MISSKVIALDEMDGLLQTALQRVMRMVPERDKHDHRLRRLLAFRLKIDGEAATSEYLVRHIRDAVKCTYRGKLYDFLTKEDVAEDCRQPGNRSLPSGAA